MRTRILPLLITMLFALSLASNAAANENSKMTPGTIAVVNNPDSNDRLNLRTNPSPDAPTLGKYYNGTYLEVLSNEKNGWVKVSIFELQKTQKKWLNHNLFTKHVYYPCGCRKRHQNKRIQQKRNESSDGIPCRRTLT